MEYWGAVIIYGWGVGANPKNVSFCINYRKVPSLDYLQNNHYPLFIHLSIVNPLVFYLSIHYPVINGYLEFSSESVDILFFWKTRLM